MGLPVELPPTPALAAGFDQSWQALINALQPLPGDQRRSYATLLLSRLIAVAALQQRGYLGSDEWYLHNQFGQSQQRDRDRFFAQVLQPLYQQGFTLPAEERPPALQQQFGPLPFVPTGPFRFTALDQRWGHIPLPDAAFEPALHWLADLAATATAGLDAGLGILLEQVVNGYDGAAVATPAPLLEALCDRTIHATLLDRAEALIGHRHRSTEHLLADLSPTTAGALLGELGQLTLLDPACGSGRFLVAALNHWIDLAQRLRAIAARTSQSVPDWALPGDGRARLSPTLGLYHHLASHSLYGLDLWPPAVELARLRLWLQGVQHTYRATELARLPDLTLTVLQGNSLVGLVRVDAERFDQVPARRNPRAGSTEAPTEALTDAPTDALTGADSPLQGNLLQPLLADSYQSVLTERQVRLEHYRSQTRLLAEVGNVPTYAQTDFLRDRLDELNAIAHGKLTHLLWSECSQQMSLRISDPGGRRPTRPLSQADVEAAQPFHWGFYFHHRLGDQGGFDIVLSHFPAGAIEATQAGFVDRYATLFEHKQVAPSTFLHNHRQVLTIDPDLTQAWAEYRGQFTWLSQYLRRSTQYPHSSHRGQSRLYASRLFLERSMQLLRPGGRCAVVLEPFWAQSNSASLRHWLQRETDLAAVVDLSNHQKLWPDLPTRTTLCALWLRHQGPTRASPYSAYAKPDGALDPTALGKVLQRLLHLAE
ncbi:MAG: DNA methyltransferase [Nodosilinea sp.]